MKRVVVFMLTAVLLIGSVPVKELKAEVYMSVCDVLDALGVQYDKSELALSTTYYLFYTTYNAAGEVIDNVLFINHHMPVRVENKYLLYNSSGNSLGNYVLGTYYYTDGVLVYRNPVGGQPNYGCLQLGGATSAEVVYANFDTNFLKNSIFTDVENDDLSLVAHEHTWIAKEESGSCITDSKTWEECSVCGAIQNEVITPASGHVWSYQEEPATCTASGRSWEECECGEIQNEMVLDPVEHSWISKVEAATCTKTGYLWDECSVCAAVQNKTELSALGHGALIYQVVKYSTVSEEGEYIQTCSVCGDVIERGVIDMLRPTSTPRPTATPRPDVTITPRPTATPKPTVTMRPTPTPRVTVVPVSPDYEEYTGGLLSVTTVMMSLFTEFPLNLIVAGWIILLGTSIYILLKRS